MSTGKLFNAMETAMLVGVSLPTLNNWYKFKRYEPDNEMSKLLPEPIQQTARQTRYWTGDDITELIKFRTKIVTGRKGFMGSVTQAYTKYKKEKKIKL